MNARYLLKKAFKVSGVGFRSFHPGRKRVRASYKQVEDFGRVAAHLGPESVDITRRGEPSWPLTI